MKRPFNKQSIKAPSGAGRTPNKQSIHGDCETDIELSSPVPAHTHTLGNTDATMAPKPKSIYTGG